MNSDDTRIDAVFHDDDTFTPSEHERRESLVTAYALGELDPTMKAEVERMLADPADSESRRQAAEVRAIAEALKGGIDDESRTRSAELRKAVLAAVARPEPSRTRSAGRGWTLLFGAIAASLLVAVTLPMVRRAKQPAGERLVAAARGGSAPAPVAEKVETNQPIETAGVEANRFDVAKDEAQAEIAGTAAAPSTPLAAPVASGFMAQGQPASIQFEGAEYRFEGIRSDRVIANMPAEHGSSFRQGTSLQSAENNGSAGGQQPFAGEGYATIREHQTSSPKDQPLSTFSIDVDTASYANVRRFLDSGRLPPRDAVRIEELVNYFPYTYPQPEGDVPFSVTVGAAECPWNRTRRLVRIGLQGRTVEHAARPAGNLVFLVDVSGSMQQPNKLPLVQQSLSMLVEELTENDRVSIVTYAGNAGLVLPPTTGDQKKKIRDAIQSLVAGGSTHGSAGIALAYEQAREHFIDGGTNRVILATDGDLNVGVTSAAALTELIMEKAKQGVFLTVLGFGEGNLQDEKMEALADNGNGVYAYIDGLREARKVLVEQLAGSTVTIAKDVKIQVEFNPAQVASYRLLGYENRALAAKDFRDDTKDAGDIGAGHRVTALYEIALVDEAAGGPGVEPLKYQPQAEVVKPAGAAAIDPAVRGELLTVKLRWKRPDGDVSTGLEVPLADRGGSFADAPSDMRFAAAVAAFGMILRESEHKGDATLPKVAEIAGGALGRDEGGYRAEFLDLVRKAESLLGR